MKIFAKSMVLSLLGIMSLSLSWAKGGGVTLPPGFDHGLFTTGFSDIVTKIKFAPDGRLFALQKKGQIRVVTAQGTLLPTPFMTVQRVEPTHDQGLVGITFDPGFSANKYVYLFYSRGGTDILSRVKQSAADPNLADPATEVTLLTVNGQGIYHTGGAMEFGADGMLYLATGNGSTNPGDQDSQKLGDLRGKLLRLNAAGFDPSNPASLIPSDNPYVGVAGVRPEVFAYGLRNPFTGQIKPGTSTMFINMVGGNKGDGSDSEYIEVSSPKANFGWPMLDSGRVPTGVTPPFYSYTHASVRKGGSGAITGGVFVNGGPFPPEYQGKYIFAELEGGWMQVIDPNASRAVATPFVSGISRPISSIMGPDGGIYYVSVENAGNPVYRISYRGQGQNLLPSANASANVTSGLSPLTVSFNANGSTDLDGDKLTYQWFFGDGATATTSSASHVYANNGKYSAYVRVIDGRGGITNSAPISITVGDRAPVAKITIPGVRSNYSAGDTIQFSGGATDADTGPIPAASLTWTVRRHHGSMDLPSSPGADVPTGHEHVNVFDATGVASGSFTLPADPSHNESAPNQYYRLILTATDPAGLSSVAETDIMPNVSTITLKSNVAGAIITLESSFVLKTPATNQAVVGSQRTLSAPPTIKVRNRTLSFKSWSDGGAATHQITQPAKNTTYTAIYK